MKSYGRFWRAWNRLSHRDSEEEKSLMVQNWTNGRTEHLSEMAQAEYDAACKELEAASGYDRELKRRRSICLRLMQGLQIDTSDWQRVNDFCRHPRISGKPFGRLSVEELESLSVMMQPPFLAQVRVIHRRHRPVVYLHLRAVCPVTRLMTRNHRPLALGYHLPRQAVCCHCRPSAPWLSA